MSEETYSINVITRTQDNGDGSYTTFACNSEDELIKDHPKCVEWDSKLKKDIPIEISDELRSEILNGDDEYENGYIGSDTIKIKIVDGVAMLADSISFHGGQ